MRSKKAGMLLENLESRALLTTSVIFENPVPQVVSDTVGTVDVSFQELSDTPSAPTPETVVTLTTNGLSAVPGVDFTPVQQTITLTPFSRTTVSIPILPGDAALGTRTLEVSLAPTSGAIQGASQLIVITHGSDTTPPIVVNSQALTDRGKVVAFALQFSEPMAIAEVTDVANYGAAAPRSRNEILGAVFNYGAMASFTKNIPLKSAIYDAATDTVYLLPANKVAPGRIRSPYPFQVVSPNPGIAASNSRLTDTSGNPVNSGDPVSLGTVGRFAANARLAKASPAVLSYLFGTPTPAKPKHKAK